MPPRSPSPSFVLRQIIEFLAHRLRAKPVHHVRESLAELLILMTFAGLLVWPCWRICTKAGLPGPLGLVSLIPAGLFVLLLVWALVEWPALRTTGAQQSAG